MPYKKYNKVVKPTHYRKKGTSKMIKIKKPGMKDWFKNFISNTVLSRKYHCPFPEVFRTTLKFRWEAVESGSAGTPGAQSSTFNFWLNSPFEPGNVTGSTIGTSTCVSSPGSAVDESTNIAAKNCAGLSRVFSAAAGSGLYKSIHVISSSIMVQYMPLQNADAEIIGVIPQQDSDTALISTMGVLDEAPYGKTKMITASDVKTKLYNRVNCAEFLGVPLQTYLGDPSYGTIAANGLFYYPSKTSATSGGARIFWSVKRDQLQGTGITVPLPYKVEIIYDVVFQGLQTNDIPTA